MSSDALARSIHFFPSFLNTSLIALFHAAAETSDLPALRKAPIGIVGFDQVTDGGMPEGNLTLVCGAARCGKFLLATEFLVRGAMQFGAPVVLRGLMGIRMSGYGMGDDISQSLAAGFHQHLTKPITLDNLNLFLNKAASASVSG